MASTVDKFRLNFVNYLEGTSYNLPVIHRQDSNSIKTLPCIVVEIRDTEQPGAGLRNHYKVSGRVALIEVGYDDPENENQDNLAEVLETLLYNTDWKTVLSKPTTGTDFRQHKNCTVDAFLLRGSETENEGNSTIHSHIFEAFIYGGD